MSILKSLTIKHLLMNKRRTLVTIIGIILSTALMLGIGLLFSSFYKAMLDDAIESSGDHHVIFKQLDGRDVEALKENVTIEDIFYEQNVGYAYLQGIKNDDKPYLRLKSVDRNYLNRLNLIDGRMPNNSNELLISSHIENNGGVKLNIGDTIKLELGYRVSEDGNILDEVKLIKKDDNRFYYDNGEIINTIRFTENEKLEICETREFTIVGLVKRTNMEEYYSCGYSVFTLNDEISDEDKTNAYIIYKNPRKTFENSEKLIDILKIAKGNIQYNTSLLYYYGTSQRGNFTDTVTGMLSIALTLLSLGCIIVIYNSFAISTMERKKQFGLLSSIGATKRQIRNTVFFEALIVGSIGIVIGIVGAFLGIYVVLQIINNLLKGIWELTFELTINPTFVTIPIIFMCMVILISAWLPAKRASKVTPVEAIRQNDEIKINKKKIRTSKIIRKLFGVEGEIALKNIKRNKRKYRITIISLFISIVLFISFSSYLQFIVSTSQGLVYSYNYDSEVNIYEEDKEKIEQITNEILNISDIKEYSIIKEVYLRYDDIGKNRYNKEYYEYIEGEIAICIVAIQDTEYKEYISKVNGKYGDAILLNQARIEKDNVTMMLQPIEDTKNLKFNLRLMSNQESKESFEIDNNIIETQQTTLGTDIYKYTVTPTLIINDEMFEKIDEWHKVIETEERFSSTTRIFIKTSNTNKFKEESDKIEVKYNMTVINYTLDMQQERNVVIALKLLLYGFISLVTLIGVTSVFNTISTSISLRQKEFAMLRSMGLTPLGFNKILFLESLFFGLKSLLYALPVSFGVIYLISVSIANLMKFSSLLIPWNSIIISVIGVFLIVLATMMYSASKIKKENILEAIRQENI